MRTSSIADQKQTIPVHLCLHCETPFETSHASQRFCCAGCQFVYDLLHREGLQQFYELKGTQSLTPLKDHHVETLDAKEWEWLSPLVEEAERQASEQGRARAEATFGLGGISCVACIWLLEALLPQGGEGAHLWVQASDGILHLTWPVQRYSVAQYATALAKHGYRLSLRPTQAASQTRDTLGIRTAICAGFSMNAMAFSFPFYAGLASSDPIAPLLETVAGASATGSLLVGGSWFFGRAWRALKRKLITMEVPIALGIVLAYLGSLAGSFLEVKGLFYFDFVATFTFLMLLGRWIQQRILNRHTARLRNVDPVPEKVKTEDDRKEIHRDDLKRGDHYWIQGGQILPVQSAFLGDTTEFSLDWINGEPDPLVVHKGKILPAGARLASHESAKVRALEDWSQSSLAHLLKRHQNFSEEDPLRASSSHFQTLLKVYLVSVILIAVLAFSYWWSLDKELGNALQVAISVLVVSCPCALGISIPLADERVAAMLRRHGVFVRSVDLWNRLSKVTTLVFDKTGTLSMASPKLKNPEKLSALSDKVHLALSHLVQGSRHPYCLSLCETMAAQGVLTFFDRHEKRQGDEPVQEIPGHGVQWLDRQGKLWTLGREDWQSSETDSSQKFQNGSVLKCEGELIAHFEFEETERADAAETIREFQQKGYQVHITSGDREERVQQMARKLGIPPEHAHGNLTPDQKRDFIMQQRHQILYLGDGANDIPSFQAALCRGTPVSEDTPATRDTDFYWQGSGLQGISHLLILNQKRSSAVRAAFLFFLLYNALVLTLSVLGLMSPLFAAIVMPISSVLTLVIITAMIKEKKK